MNKIATDEIAPARYRKAVYSLAALAVLILLWMAISGPVHALDTPDIPRENRAVTIYYDMPPPAHDHIFTSNTARLIENTAPSDCAAILSDARPDFTSIPGKIAKLYWWWIASVVFTSIVLSVFLGPGLAGRIMGTLIAAFSIFLLIVYIFFGTVSHVPFETYKGIIALITVIAGIVLSWCRKDLAAGILFMLMSIAIAFFTDIYMNPALWLGWGFTYLAAGALLIISWVQMRIKRRKSEAS